MYVKGQRSRHALDHEARQRLTHNEKAIANDLTSNKQPSHRGFTQTQPVRLAADSRCQAWCNGGEAACREQGARGSQPGEAVACTSYLRFWGKITMAAAILVPFPEAVVPVRPTMSESQNSVVSIYGDYGADHSAPIATRVRIHHRP